MNLAVPAYVCANEKRKKGVQKLLNMFLIGELSVYVWLTKKKKKKELLNLLSTRHNWCTYILFFLK